MCPVIGTAEDIGLNANKFYRLFKSGIKGPFLSDTSCFFFEEKTVNEATFVLMMKEKRDKDILYTRVFIIPYDSDPKSVAAAKAFANAAIKSFYEANPPMSNVTFPAA
ncbi:MAG: hypothetical protein LBQ59_01830 [Candidatus Peribacteria bacterium]|jgi:hypothetical protein|nr:hypothetical protein [Candidatus Peribacteria bacterium]